MVRPVHKILEIKCPTSINDFTILVQKMRVNNEREKEGQGK